VQPPRQNICHCSKTGKKSSNIVYFPFPSVHMPPDLGEVAGGMIYFIT
jgi:hypothetical protein